MADPVLTFYESLAEHYHLIFDDWTESIHRQSRILDDLLSEEVSGRPWRILDCACGIGTQAIGLASRGHIVTASDFSPAQVKRARREAELRSLEISFHVSDITSLAEIEGSDFDVVMALDNALPHLRTPQLESAVRAIASKIGAKGVFVASIRNYDEIILEKPTIQEPAFFGSRSDRRIVHQVWDWTSDTSYVVHLYITKLCDEQWQTYHFASEYRSVLRQELSGLLLSAGFGQVRWLMPLESGFYQPIVIARKAR